MPGITDADSLLVLPLYTATLHFAIGVGEPISNTWIRAAW